MNTENTEIKSLIALIVATLIILSGFLVPTTSNAEPRYEYEHDRHKSDKHHSYDRKRAIHRGPAQYERART